jgi:hypothetical protein
MSENFVLIIVATVVGVAIIAVAVYFLLRFMRGSIKLTLQQTAFEPGETIKGSFELVTKKTIQGNKLIVSLIGTKETKTNEGDKSRSDTREIYRNEVLLEEAKLYPAGHSSKHDFELPTPNSNTPDFLNSPLAKTLTTTFQILNSSRTQYHWKVEARLDAKGIDLATSRKVTINIQALM